MKIADAHMFHGAALLQVAEHPRFTAINAIEIQGQKSRSAYRINGTIGVFLKYASKPSKTCEYVFTFAEDHLQELGEIDDGVMHHQTFIALVCVEDREIACLTWPQLQNMVELREKDKGEPEDQYVVLVTARKGSQLRVYVKSAGKRGTILGEKLLIKRRSFPADLFGDDAPG